MNVGDVVTVHRTGVPTKAKVLDIFRDRVARVEFLHNDFRCWIDIEGDRWT